MRKSPLLKFIKTAKSRIRAPILRRKRRQRLIDETYRQYALAGVTPPPFALYPSSEPSTPTDVVLVREKGKIVALVNEDWRWMYLHETINKIACYSYWFSQTSPDVRQIVVDASDGNFPTMADYKFVATSDRHTALPASYFFRDHGYAATDQFAAENPVSWDDRTDDIIWRGQPNGLGVFSLEPDTADNPLVIQRLRMAMKCRDLAVDFRFTANPLKPYSRLLQQAQLIGPFVPTHDWGRMKYAIDIDGFTNAWNSYLQRLKLGCCVLKVDSPMGYYQWYYPKLRAWEHYVPIRADLSDLAIQIDWVNSNPDKAREIAANGQTVASSLRFESETKVAARAIEAREAI